MKTVICVLLFALAASAQTLPSNWYGAFANYNSAASPKVGGGVTEASLVSQSAQTYSYNTWDVTLIKQPKGAPLPYTFQSSPRAGMAMILPSLGPFPFAKAAEYGVYLIGFANIGVATTSRNASLATSAGGVLLWKIGTTKWTLFGGYHVLNTGALGGSRTVPEFGLGRTF